jgi:hypothetical protein
MSDIRTLTNAVSAVLVAVLAVSFIVVIRAALSVH